MTGPRSTAASPSSAPLSPADMLAKLVAFDTTSRHSNLQMIAFIREYLDSLGVVSELVYNDQRDKANLYATIGPDDIPGVCLSGHTDVVPVDGQDWHSDPFVLQPRDGRLYGRGSADMKGFIAVCLALAPEMVAADLKTPLHFAFSYDEEVGCLGVQTLLAVLEQRPLQPRACIVGEPTSMQVIRGHKGKLSMYCRVRGLAGHSSLAHRGVNAVEAAAEAVARLKQMARRHRDHGPHDDGYEPPYTTIHTGTIAGGVALNIIPEHCEFVFEFRHLPEDDPQRLLQELQDYVADAVLPEMRRVDPSCGFDWRTRANIPALGTPEDAEIVALARALTGRNDTGKVSFGSEAGLFQQAGMPCVVCGPGSIEQAHKPDEYVDANQIDACERFVRALIRRCRNGLA